MFAQCHHTAPRRCLTLVSLVPSLVAPETHHTRPVLVATVLHTPRHSLLDSLSPSHTRRRSTHWRQNSAGPAIRVRCCTTGRRPWVVGQVPPCLHCSTPACCIPVVRNKSVSGGGRDTFERESSQTRWHGHQLGCRHTLVSRSCSTLAPSILPRRTRLQPETAQCRSAHQCSRTQRHLSVQQHGCCHNCKQLDLREWQSEV